MADKLRLLLTTGNYNGIKDGVSLTLNRLVGWLGANGVEVMVVAPAPKVPAFEHEGRLEQVPSLPIPTRAEYRVGLPIGRGMRRRIIDFEPDLFHISVPDFTGHSALRLARSLRVPVVASYHTRFDTYLDYYKLQALKRWVNRRERAFYEQCEHLYVPSRSMMDELRTKGIAGDNMRLWTRGVDHQRFSPAKRSMEWRRARGIADDDVLVTFAGRLVAEKNTDLLMRVFADLGRRGALRCRTMLIGDGPEEAAMRRALPQTVFAGFLHGEDLATAYASSDVFFFPSASETFGSVTLEAMASGLPAVNADATGSRSLVRDGETGFLVEPADAAGMVERIAELAKDERLRSAMGTRAREIALRDHDWDAIFSRLLADYRDAIAGYDRRHR